MKRYTIFLVLAIAAMSVFAQAKMSLQEAKDYAIAHSLELKLQQYEVDKARLLVKESLASLLPQVTGGLDYTHYGKLPTSIIPENAFGNPEAIEVAFGFKENVSAKIEMTQVIFNGVFLIGLKGAEVYVDMISQEKAVKEEELLYQVVRAYFTALVAAENAGVVRQNIDNIAKLLYETEQIYLNGLAEELDVDRLKLSLSNLKTQVNYLDKQKELTLTLLKFTIGMPVDSTLELSDKLEDFLGSASMIPEAEADFSDRREMKLMDIREMINEINIKRYKAGYYPTVNFFAGVGSQAQRNKWNFFNFDEPWYNTRLLGVNINVPIWDSFGKRAKVQGAKVDVQRIRTGKEYLLESYRLAYKKAVLEMDQAKEELENTLSNLALAEKIYRTTQLKYREGVGSSLEMNSAERELYAAQANYINAVYKVLIANADINKALGKN
jgi:outer membrane protein